MLTQCVCRMECLTNSATQLLLLACVCTYDRQRVYMTGDMYV